MIEAALPEITLSNQSGLVRDFTRRISSLTDGIDSDEDNFEELEEMENEGDVDAVIMTAQMAKRVDSHKINITVDTPPLTIVTGNLPLGSQYEAMNVLEGDF
jgi:hypothetical protein